VSFEVVVLGASGTVPAPGSACSGYLLRSQGAEVWVDAGSGTFANLLATSELVGLQALVLTHMHLDHVADVYPFYHWVRFGRGNPGLMGVPVHAPPGSGPHLAQILTPYGTGTFGEYLRFNDIGDGHRVTIGPFTLTFARTLHPVETYAVRAEAEGRVVVYTADTGPSDHVTALAEGADVLVAEASMQEARDDMREVHMTATEAGEMAGAAGAGRLVLTHIPPGLDPGVSVEQARVAFGGDVVVAADRLVLPVEARSR
jgi:ribonuclease BN (tRNA processing enzyme)